MAHQRTQASSANSNVQTAYALSLLSEYTHSLDALPLDICRIYAEMHELEAVVATPLSELTKKVHTLIRMIETNPGGSKQERLRLLSEIAEEATRLKGGGEDKIRIASHAADCLKGHMHHMRALLENLPGIDPGSLRRRTTYPHISPRSYMPTGGIETGRRRRGGYGSILTSSVESPSKRKRVQREDDGEERANGRSPRKERGGESSQRNRNTARNRRQEGAGSPAESVLSVTSYMPNNNHESPRHIHNPNNSISSRALPSSSNAKRSRPTMSVMDVSYDRGQSTNHVGNPTAGGSVDARRELFNSTAGSASSSSALLYGNGAPAFANSRGGDWPSPAQLEGPGMPVSRSPLVFPPAVNTVESVAGDADPDGDEEVDNRRYCICDNTSYGEMIACDDSTCEKEWFHLGCLNLSVLPTGRWFCDACKAKKNAKRNSRGGKRKANNNRSGGKAVANGA